MIRLYDVKEKKRTVRLAVYDVYIKSPCMADENEV